jgi:drug/metabolite transporter (DMT)-like permease
MLPQIAILAWLFLDEPLTPWQIAGLALVAAGTLIVQVRRPSGRTEAQAIGRRPD